MLLDEQPGLPELDLPDELRRLYGGGLGFDDPSLVVNFVQTVDGVVAIPDVESSNALIAHGSKADRFVMGLLRACADVILVGSGTLHGSPKGLWQPGRVYPPGADAFAELRRRLGKSARPILAVVTGSGAIDPMHPVLAQGAIALTTEEAAGPLAATVPASTEVVAINARGPVDLTAALAVLHDRGHSLVLSEGGPTLFGSLVGAGLVNDLFLTVSPLLAGRDVRPRLGLVEGVELPPASAEVRSIRRHGDHLFLRYRLDC